ncbi:hypothetical protein NIES2135_20170 [Leptolyngbya boryana NIES-2135]|uniref:Uncharacterized protein n=1 Tax=Leptolyngbya boryana NIES-2135 TaxID=1973484 RepID=A0A1Z4JEI5_LEPBY|nr:hypothetical protein [Leptolyngbya sp. FACHB-1624]BAY55195.1 hypothetical protein NIES2135_20170 [Leptolyngbya boryana NIES-2135]
MPHNNFRKVAKSKAVAQPNRVTPKPLGELPFKQIRLHFFGGIHQ